MDIVSYGVASKAGKQKQNTHNNVLGLGVEGAASSVKVRLDILEQGIEKVNEQANRLIISDTINIMKAHAKFNSVANTMKYKMHNMVFDDLLDLSGIDTAKSSAYTHDELNGWLLAGANCVIVTQSELTEVAPTKIVLTVEEEGSRSNYFISRDDGVTWESIQPNTLFYFKQSISPVGNQLRLKANMPTNTKLLNYGLTWA